MRLILKKEKKRPKAPKTATLATLERYRNKIKEVEQYNKEVRKENAKIIAMSRDINRAVAGFGKGTKSAKRGRK